MINRNSRYYPRKTLSERFWGKVQKTLGCWLWSGCRNTLGYGIVSPGGQGNNVYAHRISWELHFSSIPKNMCVLHHCDNPSCVRPDHLFLGTHKDNALDKVQKGRSLRGERHSQAKLDTATVLIIRERYASGGFTQKTLANEYGVSGSQIGWITSRKCWTHI